MAVYAGPDIVENGLIVHLDAANPRSYPGSGTSWFDLSGRNNHFTLINSPVFSNNRFIFDGINDYAISLGSISDLSTTNSFTIQYIFKPTTYPNYNGSNGKILCEYSVNFNLNNNSFLHNYIIDTDDSAISTATKGAGGIFQNYNYSTFNKSFFSDLNWKFGNFICNRNISGAQTAFYTQAQKRTAISSPLTATNSANFENYNLYIACRGGSSFFADFELAFFTIYSRVLTDSEILQNYNALRGRFNL
jgi:hypothetical protein